MNFALRLLGALGALGVVAALAICFAWLVWGGGERSPMPKPTQDDSVVEVPTEPKVAQQVAPGTTSPTVVTPVIPSFFAKPNDPPPPPYVAAATVGDGVDVDAVCDSLVGKAQVDCLSRIEDQMGELLEACERFAEEEAGDRYSECRYSAERLERYPG